MLCQSPESSPATNSAGRIKVRNNGLIATGAVLAAYAVCPADSAWLTLAGLVATVAAYLIALLSLRRGIQ